jgi:NOL1/NOP2/sun family putative RNA methylase
MPELEPFPNKDAVEFKRKFIERYSKLTDFEKFKKHSLAFPNKAIRVNTLKADVDKVKRNLERNWNLEQVPWCKQAFWIRHPNGRRDLGNLTEHSLGYIYVQEASSMIPPIALQPEPGDIVLDMCASPGSKTTQMAAMMNNEGLIFANDIEGKRLAPLGINIQRSGITNAVITLMKGELYKNSSIRFDKILVDAPCSGTGTISKSIGTLKMWNPKMIKRLASVQKRLLETAFSILKPGGFLVYSTCSNEPEEDEGVISDFLDAHEDVEMQEVKLPLNSSSAIMEFEGKSYNPNVKKCLRIWPQDNSTEGFFVAKIRKKK